MRAEIYIAESPPWLRGILYGFAFCGLMYLSGPASAACMCMCLDGVQTTICETLDEADADPTLCEVAAVEHVGENLSGCPLSEGVALTTSYGGPEGATDCRDRYVWNGIAYLSVPVCAVTDSP